MFWDLAYISSYFNLISDNDKPSAISLLNVGKPIWVIHSSSNNDLISSSNLPATNIAKSIILYEYNNTYYLVFDNINLSYKYLKKLCSSITEFATYKVNPDLFIIKLTEKGTIVMKNNAIKTALKHFANSK